MYKTITTFKSLEEIKAMELRQWQSLSAYERLRATSELTLALYRMKEPDRDVQRNSKNSCPPSTREASSTSEAASSRMLNVK
jgi:hypothetical protein